MLKVPITSARPGMTLAMPVLHPDLPGHTLLRPGFTLDGPSLSRLLELRVSFLWIVYPALESALRYVNPALVTEHANVTAVIGKSLDRLREVRDHRFAELDFKPYVIAVRDLIGKLAASTGALLLVHDLVGTAQSPLALHSSNVCFLSLLLGLKLDQYLIAQRRKLPPQSARNIENLGVSALLHDVGVTRLAPETIEHFTATGDDSTPAYQAHVRLGYEMLRGRVEPTAAVAVLQHHQRWDGKGYPRLRVSDTRPRALKGEEIHVFARILAVADRYDLLRNPPAGFGLEEARRPVVRVLSMLLHEARTGGIDPIVFKGLLHVVPAFAPGTIVRLSDGRHAVVIEFDPLHPCLPVVRHIRHIGLDFGTGDDNLGEVIDLRHRATLSIAEAEGHDVARDLFHAQHEAEFDLRVFQHWPSAQATPAAPIAALASRRAA